MVTKQQVCAPAFSWLDAAKRRLSWTRRGNGEAVLVVVGEGRQSGVVVEGGSAAHSMVVMRYM